MNRGLLWIAAALCAGTVSFFAMRWHRQPAAGHLESGHAMPGLLWLRGELALTGEQFAMVKSLHESYQPKCAEMCDLITASHERIDRLTAQASTVTPELADALRQHADVHLDCQRAMLGHLFETAAAMEAAQARRYLDLVLPYATDFAHSEGGCPLCGANANLTSNGSK